MPVFSPENTESRNRIFRALAKYHAVPFEALCEGQTASQIESLYLNALDMAWLGEIDLRWTWNDCGNGQEAIFWTLFRRHLSQKGRTPPARTSRSIPRPSCTKASHAD